MSPPGLPPPFPSVYAWCKESKGGIVQGRGGGRGEVLKSESNLLHTTPAIGQVAYT